MDPEIEAMTTVAKAIEPLQPDARRRVMAWVLERYEVSVKRPVGAKPQETGESGKGDDGGEPATFSTFDELFDAANPMTAVDKALVAAYWFQVHEKSDDLDAAKLNNELKHLGHQSKNITRDLDALIDRSPRYTIQVKKTGSTKQARKRYKLTREGIRAVERMIQGGDGEV